MDDTAPDASAADRLAEIEDRLSSVSDRVDRIAEVLGQVRQLVGPFGALMPNGRMLVQSLHEIKYLIDPNDLVIAPHLIIYRQWEAQLTHLFFNLLHENSVFVDVGAYFGYFTCLAGSKIRRSGTGRVIAIEPNPTSVELLRANVAINWSMSPIDIEPYAVGDREGRAILALPPIGAANASLSPPGPLDGSVEVEVRTLDSIVPEGTAVHMLKMDVEGHEAAALRGARRVFSESPDIVVAMEWSKEQIAAARSTPEDLLAILDELGLQTFTEPSNGQLETAEPVSVEALMANPYTNLILRRRS